MQAYADISENIILNIYEYPLNKYDINNMLQKSYLDWTAKEPKYSDTFILQTEYTRHYMLYKGLSKIGMITTSSYNNERGLFLTFISYFDTTPYSYIDIYNPHEAYWENIITFVTLLYGGFDDKNSILFYFKDEIDMINRYTVKPPLGWIPGISSGNYINKSAIWEKNIDDTYVRIIIVSHTASTYEYFRSIGIFSNAQMVGI